MRLERQLLRQQFVELHAAPGRMSAIEQSLRVPEDLRGQVMVVPFQGLIDWARKNSK